MTKSNPRWQRTWLNGYEIAGSIQRLDRFGTVYNVANVTGWRDQVVNFTLGHPQIMFGPMQAVFDNRDAFASALGESFPTLYGMGEYVVTHAIGVQDFLDEGDPVFMATFRETEFNVDGDGPILLRADFRQGLTRPYSNCWGKAIVRRVAGSVQVTTVFDPVDYGAGSADGCVIHFHVYGGFGTVNYQYLVEHSPTGAWAGEEATLHTFSADGSVRAVEVADINTAVDQHIRFTANKTSGITAFAAALSMK